MFKALIMKLQKLFDSVYADCVTLLLNKEFKDFINSRPAKHFDSIILDKISKDRAFDNSHPFYANGTWNRILSYDGRDYCFFYSDGANDTHVKTLQKAVFVKLKENKLIN
jgi:hypothetical protein